MQGMLAMSGWDLHEFFERFDLLLVFIESFLVDAR